MATLIGSRALKHWIPDYKSHEDDMTWDWDWHSPVDFDPHTMMYGFEIYPGQRHDVFVDPRLGAWDFGPIATPSELYTIKISHGYWDINGTWDKHAADIVFLKRYGAQFIPELHDMLLEIWKDRYQKNTISLDKTADEFFNDHVKKVYVHDTVHESVAYHERPWFESILKDGSEVLVDNSKFWAMDLRDQLELVREELYVIALERVLIPRDYKGSPMAAYRWALRRTAISLFKNKWATFLLLHLDELGRPDCDYVARHKANSHMLRLMPEV